RARAWVAVVGADMLDASALPAPDLAGDAESVDDDYTLVPTRAVEQTSNSSVRITGSAYECGQSQTGSGFAVAANRVITNAHVVAAVQAPQVESLDGQLVTGQVVAFDPDVDVAIIDLPGPQLPVTR